MSPAAPKPRFPPLRIDNVVDGARLRAQLTAGALDGIGDDAAVREKAKNLIHGALFRGRMIAKERLDDGENGLAVARLLSAVMDQALSALYDFTTTHVFRARNPTEGERMAVVAVGGYGRGELAPSSDIDLLFVRNYKLTPWAESVIEYMLYMLWDMGLKVGHASRSIDESVKLARDDHTIETSLLEMRRIAGDDFLAKELAGRFRSEVVDGRHAAFIAAKLAERDQRHARAGASRYMVEPNVKEGRGGLRDLHTLFWLARHRYGFSNAADYAKAAVFTRQETMRFGRAMRFLWTVRCHLHFLTGRAEERLSFDVQPELAARMGFGSRGAQQAVERFMKRYFLEVKEVGALNRALCAKLEEDEASPKGLSRLFAQKKAGIAVDQAPGFLARAGRLELDDLTVLDNPVNLLRMFLAADANRLDIHPALLREARARARKITPAVRRMPEARRTFLDIVASKRTPARILRLMNETGVLGRMLPEFDRIVAQMQFNMYHHYTVDEHTLRAVDIINDIELGKYKSEHPLASDIFAKIINRRALYLAMLLHDTGKGIGDQQEEGAKVAVAACVRLGLEADEVELVAWLVGNHLAMSDVAQKRDLGDPRTVAQFASLTGTVERLRLLLVLTIADMRAVGPGVWNGWKAQLLRELYRLTEAAFHGGRTDEATVATRLAAQAQEARDKLVAGIAPKARAKVRAWVDALDDAYWLSFDQEALAWHAKEATASLAVPDKAHVAARLKVDVGTTELLVIAPDQPRLFASLAAACSTAGADIADARINTTTGGRAFDVFSVQTIDGSAFGADDPDALASLIARLERAAIAGHPPPPKRMVSRRLAAFAIAPWVRFDNQLAGHATVLEVSGRDRPGLLAALVEVLAQAGVQIQSAHIGAYGERVADVFYVVDESGQKLKGGRKLSALRKRLVKVLSAEEPAAPADPAKQPMAIARASTAR